MSDPTGETGGQIPDQVPDSTRAPAADPAAGIRAAQRISLPKRFYKEVGVKAGEGGFSILLDGRPVRTPARAVLQAPTRALAEAMAGEWAAQAQEIDPATMPLTRLVNVGLDRVPLEAAAVADEVVNYAGTDMVFYRAEAPQSLVARQARHWDKVLDFMRETHGARFFLTEGIRHVAQPPESLDKVRARVPADPLALAAVHSITTLTGSALIALMVAEGALSADEAWTAAHVDEDFNREQWGEDEAASARRAARRKEMDAAALLLAALRSDP